ncbi:MAG: PilT/PilU family type 4a pilus ATPase [Candidatus Omnitrophica bacterium]|nr:PilT/PilU family type 4a pilus ATPase [Candidatus Omnitrophota bacterium]
MDANGYLKQMLEKNASDLYFKANTLPYYRVNNKLIPALDSKLQAKDVERLIDSILTDEQKKHLQLTKELDSAYSISGVGRFRFNVYFQRGTMAITFRSIKTDIPSFEELNLPVEVMKDLSSQQRGLILVTGHAGSGKSTTIAAMIDYINKNFQKHIITIEDPVEFVHTDDKSIISQREVGSDTMSFDHALRHIIRQSPDIIFVGEMRDITTMQTAIMAAETGHLVLSTLHTIDTTQTVDRIINFFPSHTHKQTRMQLSLLLKGVVSMRLVPRVDKEGRVPACEVMLSTPTVKKMIAEANTDKLISVIEEGKLFGMQSFNQALVDWLDKSIIDKDVALNYASNPDELALRLKEILPGSGNHAM